jgi:hypothetical protein
MSRAAYCATLSLISGGELRRLFRGSIAAWDACTKAIRAELKPDDNVIIEAGAGVGMTVRYRLSRKTP